MYLPQYALFYDFHTSYNCPDVAVNFDAEQFAERIKQCGVDFLTFHARCNSGLAYYDTELGIKHPTLNFDLFGAVVDACQQRGIAVSAYLNGGLSDEEALRHRDWSQIWFNGQVYDDSRNSPYVRTMCYNSPYRDHLIAMVLEIARKYPVSGFFLDCMSARGCICPYCIEKMHHEDIDWTSESAVIEFDRLSAKRLAADIGAAAKSVNPEYLIYFNDINFEDQFDSGTYLECECIPSRSDWGYEYLPVLSHYMRTLGKPCLNMTTRFYSWGDFGGIRPATAIRSELLYGLANGLRPNIGDHFHPRGDMMEPVYQTLELIYKDLKTYDPWLQNAVPKAEIGVVYPFPLKNIRFDEELRGVVRMLSELQQQFDIVTLSSDWSKYQVLIFPDHVKFDQEICERVNKHFAAGKKVIASGWSGLQDGRFAFEKEWGVQYLKDCDFDPAYFSGPGMPLSIYASGIQMHPYDSTEVDSNLIKPYYLNGWDGIRHHYYNPPGTETQLPFLTLSDQVAHFSHALFTGYRKWGAPHLRNIFAKALSKMLPEPMLKIEKAPSYLRAFVTAQPEQTMVHLLAYLPEKRGIDTEMIEDELTVPAGMQLRFRCNATKVYRAPDGIALDFCSCNGYTTVTLPQFSGYALIVFEK